MTHLALKNLRLRKLRTALSMMAVAVGIMTLVVLRGLTEGTIGEVAQRMQSVNADLLVWDESRHTMMHSRTMPASYADQIRTMPDVARVVPVLNDSISLANQPQTVYAVPAEDFFATFGGSKVLLPGGRLYRPGALELIIDTVLAKAHPGGLHVGDTLDYVGEKFTIVGIATEGVVGRVFMSYETAVKLWHNGARRANMLFVKASGPGAVEGVTADIKALGLIVVGKGNYYSVIAGDFKYLDAFVWSTTLITLFVSFLTILLTMFTIVQEQTREVGILKSLGATRNDIMTLVVTQSLIICGAGVPLGFLLSLGAKYGIALKYPLLTLGMHPSLLATALGVGILGGLLGALYPAWRAASLDPVETLSYE